MTLSFYRETERLSAFQRPQLRLHRLRLFGGVSTAVRRFARPSAEDHVAAAAVVAAVFVVVVVVADAAAVDAAAAAIHSKPGDSAPMAWDREKAEWRR